MVRNGGGGGGVANGLLLWSIGLSPIGVGIMS